MLDAVVTLRTLGDLAKIAGEKLAVEPVTAAPSDTVRIRLYARAPRRDFKLMLWDDSGRNPEPLELQPIVKEPDVEEGEVVLDEKLGLLRDGYQVEKLSGCTVTWSVRLLSPRPDSFEVRVEVFQGADPVPGGRFFYAGPLDASEIEEHAGSFHFRLASPPAQAV